MKRLLLVVLCLTMLAPTLACYRGYSEGERAGTVQKFSYKGLVWKTWEGEMLMGGLCKKRTKVGEHYITSMVDNLFKFTVLDPKVQRQVAEAIEVGEPVTLQYVQWLVAPPWLGSTYEVVGVK